MYKKIGKEIIFLIFTLLITIHFLLLSGCAKVVAPTGGQKDTTAPKVVVEESTPNLSTNFNSTEIVLTFDEWIQLNKPASEIIVSPPLNKSLDIKMKGKSVIINLEEETLRDSVTYIINFGQAIQDFRERNPAENLRFVFSTGSFIDSLSVGGKIIDSETDKPVKDALVMLYDNLSDTVVRTEKPFYFARTDKNGQYSMPFLKSDTFKIFVLLDENFNYLYDEEESIGFQSENIILTDSFKTPLDFQIFKPQPPLRRTRNITKPFGHLKIVYNQTVFDSLQVQVEPSFDSDYLQQSKDTLHFWYTDTTSKRVFIISDEKDYLDTFDVFLPKSAPFYKQNKTTRLAIPNLKSAQTGLKHNPNEVINIEFRHPIASIDLTKIIVTEDTLKTKVEAIFSQDETDPKKGLFKYKWKEEKTYQITLFPGAVTDIFNLKNDTIILNYNTKSVSEYGNVDVLIEGMNKDTSYVVELVNGKKDVVETFVMTGQESIKRTFKALPTSDYSIKIIVDTNSNGRWDTGKYPTRQPEKILLGKAEKLRPNWDLELKFNRQ